MIKSKTEIDKLIADHKRLIEAEARKYSGFIPYTFVLVEANKLAREAAQKYNPNAGVKFSTYLTNQLRKLYRLSTQFGGTVRVPEDKQFQINRLNQAETELQDTLGRPPTASELADKTGFNLPTINTLLGTRKKDVNLTNLAYAPVFMEGEDDEWVHFVYHDLEPRDKLIFEYRTGFAGKKKLDTNSIAKKLGTSPSTISQRVKFISNKILQKP